MLKKTNTKKKHNQQNNRKKKNPKQQHKSVFHERTELHGSVLQCGLDEHGCVLHCSRSGGLSWISQLRSLKRSPLGRWHTTSLVLVPPPHGLVHWRKDFVFDMRIREETKGKKKTLSSISPLPSCRRSTVGKDPTHRSAARWADCGPRSCWPGSRSHPGKPPPAAGSHRRMCWNTARGERASMTAISLRFSDSVGKWIVNELKLSRSPWTELLFFSESSTFSALFPAYVRIFSFLLETDITKGFKYTFVKGEAGQRRFG